MLENGANVNAADPEGNTALMLAIVGAGNSAECIKYTKLLIQHDADIEAKNKLGETALILAIQIRDIELVKLLIKNGADVKNPMNLVQAAASRNEEALKILIENGADVNAKIDGKSILTIFKEFRNHPQFGNVIDLLIEAGAK